jgi:hypothetical protein
VSLTISRSRRRTRLRSTALPTCFDTVKPMRAGRSCSPSCSRRRACTTNARPDALTPLAAARKSVRRLNRSTATTGIGPRSRTEALAPARAPRRKHLAAAFCRHPGAKAVAALAHQFARLVGPFHGVCLRYAPGVGPLADRSGQSNANSMCGRAIGAAYTGALPARQCDRPDRKNTKWWFSRAPFSQPPIPMYRM